jgi:hypothetical protein
LFERVELRLGLAAFLLTGVLGFLAQYIQYLGFILPATRIGSPVSLIYNEIQTLDWVSILVTYPITVVTFYLIGKRSTPKLRTKSVILATLVGALLGEVFGQTAVLLFPRAIGLFFFPFSYIPNLVIGLNLLFVGLSGFALAVLSRDKAALLSHGKRNIGIVLVVLSFFFESSFLLALEILRVGLFGGSVVEAGLLSISLNVPISLVLQFFVFYFLGRRISVNGAPFRYFGVLLVGAYIGTILGAVISVALFGQSYWSPSSLNGSIGFGDGINFPQNMPSSLVLILDSFNPIRSLPFLAFFAMSVSRLGESILAKQDPSITQDIGGTFSQAL